MAEVISSEGQAGSRFWGLLLRLQSIRDRRVGLMAGTKGAWMEEGQRRLRTTKPGNGMVLEESQAEQRTIVATSEKAEHRHRCAFTSVGT